MTSRRTENTRSGNRTKAVLPVRIKGKDTAGQSFEDLVHTLDVNASGLRLGSVRHELAVNDEVTIFYRQRKLVFRVVWIKKLRGTSEFHAGLQAVTQEPGTWGLSLSEPMSQPITALTVSQALGVA